MTTQAPERSSLPNPEDDSRHNPEAKAGKIDIPATRPDDADHHQVDDVEAQARANREKSPEERIAELEKGLAEDRDALALLGSKRGARMYSRKKGTKAELYELRHGKYTEKLRELGRLKLEHEHGNQDEQEKKTAAITYLLNEQTALRNKTTEFLKGTKIGRVVEWMNKGGRFKKIMKFAAVGAVAGVAGFATGGIAGGAVAFGVGMAARAGRGFIAAEGKNGRALNEVDQTALDSHAYRANNAMDLIDAGAAEMAGLYEGEIKDRQRKVKRAFGRGALYAGMGAGIGAAVHYGAGALRGTPESHQTVKPVAEVQHDDPFARFKYDPKENPFYRAKAGDHDLGGALRGFPADGNRPAGFSDLTQNRWTDSPEQFASICSAMGLNGTPDNLTAANALAEHFKAAPGDMSKAHGEVMKIINDPSTKVYTKQIVGPYQSEYGVDMGHGNMNLAWDDYVDQGGTKTVIEYKDPRTGLMRTLELRNDCGGQRMVEMERPPVPVYAQETSSESYVPQGTGYIQPVSHTTTTTTPQPGGGQNTYTPPPRGGYTPPKWTPPVIDIPEIPKTPLTPKSGDITDWQRPGTDNTTDSGVGTKPPVGSGVLSGIPNVLNPLGNGNTTTPGSSVNTPSPNSTPNSDVSIGGNKPVGDAGSGNTNNGDTGSPF